MRKQEETRLAQQATRNAEYAAFQVHQEIVSDPRICSVYVTSFS